jgi:hypothetical protein
MRTLVAIGLVFTAASGSSSSTAPSGSGSPSTGTPTTTTAPTTSTSGVFTFTFPTGTQLSDPDLIKNAVTAQAAFFQTVFGRTITQATTITGSTTDAGCANGGSSAFTGIRFITICVANPGWTVHNALNRQKIIMHELFHVLQFEMQRLGHPATRRRALEERRVWSILPRLSRRTTMPKRT